MENNYKKYIKYKLKCDKLFTILNKKKLSGEILESYKFTKEELSDLIYFFITRFIQNMLLSLVNKTMPVF